MEFLHSLANIRTPFGTALFQGITLFGEEAIIVCLLCALYWCRNKQLAYGVGMAFFLSAAVVQGLKITFRIDRPWLLDPTFVPVASALEASTGYSFPSGHTQCAAALYGYLGVSCRRWYGRAALFALVLLVGFSRMYLGVHTPADVGASLLVTALIIACVYFCFRAGVSDAWLAGIVAALGAAVLVYALALYGAGVIEMHYASDCCKAAGGCLGCAVGLLWERRGIRFSERAPLWQQTVKFLVGMAGVVGIRWGLKALLGASLLVDTLRYGLIALWVLALYPFLFQKAEGLRHGACPEQHGAA